MKGKLTGIRLGYNRIAGAQKSSKALVVRAQWGTFRFIEIPMAHISSSGFKKSSSGLVSVICSLSYHLWPIELAEVHWGSLGLIMAHRAYIGFWSPHWDLFILALGLISGNRWGSLGLMELTLQRVLNVI